MLEEIQNPIYNIRPPTPPEENNITFISGIFDYVKNNNDRELYINAYKAITMTEMWEFMKKDPGENGYMFSHHPELQIICTKMNELFGGYINNPHSGCSFACTMRAMQYIAKNGELAFKYSKNY